MLRVLLELARVSNLPTVWSNVLAAWFLAGGHWSSTLAWMMVGGSLIYSAGMLLNDAADAAWDRQHKKDRPIPSGRIRAGVVWTLGLAGMMGGAFACVVAGGADWRWVLALIAAVVAYDLYHKPWAGSVLVMGACRTFLYAATASGVGPVPEIVWRWGLILGVYIVALSLVARGEARGSLSTGVRWLLYGLLLAPSWMALTAGYVAWLVPAVALIVLVTLALKEMRKGGPCIGNAVGWLLAGIPLVDALAVSRMDVGLMIAFVLVVPVLKWWQRFVAAT